MSGSSAPLSSRPLLVGIIEQLSLIYPKQSLQNNIIVNGCCNSTVPSPSSSPPPPSITIIYSSMPAHLVHSGMLSSTAKVFPAIGFLQSLHLKHSRCHFTSRAITAFSVIDLLQPAHRAAKFISKQFLQYGRPFLS